MALPGGLLVSTRVTRRSEERQGPDRLATSEFFQQLIASEQAAQPKVGCGDSGRVSVCAGWCSRNATTHAHHWMASTILPTAPQTHCPPPHPPCAGQG